MFNPWKIAPGLTSKAIFDGHMRIYRRVIPSCRLYICWSVVGNCIQGRLEHTDSDETATGLEDRSRQLRKRWNNSTGQKQTIEKALEQQQWAEADNCERAETTAVGRNRQLRKCCPEQQQWAAAYDWESAGTTAVGRSRQLGKRWNHTVQYNCCNRGRVGFQVK